MGFPNKCKYTSVPQTLECGWENRNADWLSMLVTRLNMLGFPLRSQSLCTGEGPLVDWLWVWVGGRAWSSSACVLWLAVTVGCFQHFVFGLYDRVLLRVYGWFLSLCWAGLFSGGVTATSVQGVQLSTPDRRETAVPRHTHCVSACEGVSGSGRFFEPTKRIPAFCTEDWIWILLVGY